MVMTPEEMASQKIGVQGNESGQLIQTKEENNRSAVPAKISLIYDRAINFAFQQNAIPVVKELRFCNDSTARKNLTIRITTEPAFAEPMEIHLQSLNAGEEYCKAPLDLKLSPNFLSGLNEKIAGWLKAEILDDTTAVCSQTEPISLLARNEWCGLASLPEILAAFILPNDLAVMTVLSRAAELLQEHTGRSAFNGYQDKSRKRAWEQVAAIYKAVSELGIRYIVAPASFENTGQKVRSPSDILSQRFGNCLDLSLLFSACCEQVGLHPVVLMHDGHAYAGTWLEERTLPETFSDDLQYIRKLVDEELVSIFECTAVTNENPGTLKDAELLARPHLQADKPFRLALDVRRSRIARIHPLPVPNQPTESMAINSNSDVPQTTIGLGSRDFADPLDSTVNSPAKPATRIDQWKSRLLDLSLRNRLLNFRETKSTIRILSSSPDRVEDELAAERELSLRPKPRVMGENDPRNEVSYAKQERADALAGHLADELKHGRLHTNLDESEHARRLTELFRAARNAIDENGTNTLFAAVGFLEWRETEHSDRIFRAPLLLVPVELKRKSVLEGFSLRRIDEEPRLNITLMEMLRQHFQKEIPGLDPLPEDQSGVDVGLVFRIFRDAVRDLSGWEVKTEVWLAQFSFTKFLLWKDLADRLDDLTRNRVVNHLVNHAGTPYPNPDGDIRPEQLDDEFHPRNIFCPRSADSSQLAAVMAAAAGHDFVLEGPPGTGKSQTIANIIAHCLAHGKRVLFVAEKRAALDVVYRRLREEGLEPFCLELHSNKTGKADVVAQFDRSLRFLTEEDATDWERRAGELECLRDSLNGYVRALHRRHPCGLSAYHCLDYLLPRQKEPTVRLDAWPTILTTSVETLEHARDVANLLQQRSRPLAPLTDHPLALFAAEEWSPAWAERTLERIRELGTLSQAAAEATHELRAWLRCSDSAVSKADLVNLSALMDNLLAPEPVGPGFATTSWAQLATDLDVWISLVRERGELRASLLKIHKPQIEGTKFRACEAWLPDQAEQIFEECRQMGDLTQQAIEAARDLHQWISFPRSAASRTDIAHIVDLVDSLLAPAPVGERFATAVWREWVTDLEKWIALVRERIDLRTLLKGYAESKLLALDLDMLDRKWQSAQKTWFLPKWLKISSVRRQLQTAYSDRAKIDAAKMGEVLKAALRLRTINGELAAANPDAEALLGPVWGRGEPQLDHLVQVRTWGAELHERLATLADDDEDWMLHLRELIAGLLKQGPAAFEVGTTIGNRLSRYRDVITKFDAAYKQSLESAALHRGPLDEAADHLPAVASAFALFQKCALRLRVINGELNTASASAQACLGILWAKGEPSADAIEKARVWGQTLHARMLACARDDLAWLNQLRQLLAGLFTEGPEAYAVGTTIGNRLSHYRDAQVRFHTAMDALASEARLRRESLDTAPDYFSAIQNLLQRIPSAWTQIREWCFWQKIRGEATKLGLSPIVDLLESVGGDALDVPALFERSFRRGLFFATVENEPSLREFFGREHNERIDRFREIDEKIAGLARELIRARLAAGIPRDQVKNDVPRAEIGLLRHEIGKKTRHIPVRQLLNRIPNLLPKLKPCVLMSPLSVAQYLEPSHAIFDVVIFDEASQIPVWDAIGAIARGRQLIVVGDPKQLPPTNFFNSSGDEEDNLAPEEFRDLESILDEMMKHGLRHKRLKWHYRSRHEGLITFSNRQYYENELLTFPSAETALGGIRFEHLPDAQYDKGKSRTNRLEAEALIAELVTRLRNPDEPRHSYGVVTFSLAQQQLIENLLDEERRKYPEIEVHFGDEPPVEGEPVFVKNLENVQGDERDVIFFSICYGADETGRVAMNFGPLNRDGGERRLNVAITRAKHEVVVFSGLRADQIDLTRTRAKGVRDLKYFLDYAERGPGALTAATSFAANGEPDSEFERMVADRLRLAGYQVHHQVGCSGYRIDLGIIDPTNPGRYQLGIECDGATYHRAATARDRDKLRQSILEGLGWKLYRVWSTDWWHDSEGEMKKLQSFLKGLQHKNEKGSKNFAD
jgi:very-short-patch-repair endonuclease